MKVYIFMLKKFYVQNGVDLPCAINNDDMKVFKSFEDADMYRSDLFEEMKDQAGIHFKREEIHTKKEWNFLALHFMNGSRFVFEIIEKELL